MMRSFSSFGLALTVKTILFSLVLAGEKRINQMPSGSSSILSLEPFVSKLWKLDVPPVCTAEEFSAYTAETLMKMNSKQINSLPASYFESLKIEQAAPLSPSFITQLHKDQAMAFSSEVASVLPKNSLKILNKIKKRPGPIARAVIMSLSAITAYVIFKYS